jgi:hypothetical protein
MKIRQIILGIVATATLLFAPVPIMVGTASAVDCGNTPAAKAVLNNLDGDQVGDECGQKRVNNLFATIVQILSIITGIASVIVIIYGGFKYITSGGEQGRVANAKSTVLYAVVGLAVAALAQLMVHFVLYQTTTATYQCPTGQHGTPPDCKND